MIRKAKDNSHKLIFQEPELLIEFLNDFIPIDLLKDIQPSDIEDVSERYLPLFMEGKDSDTVKRINLKGEDPLFVIALLEHEAKVNYRSSFKMLLYITLILEDYEKEADKINEGVSRTKGFRYPPILPIVFYDGTAAWTAEKNFLYKTNMQEVFYKYIPKFEYELVSLKDYTIDDLVKFDDTLSLMMIIDKIKTADGLSLLSRLPEDYVGRMNLKIPPHFKKLLADIITILLGRIDVPEQEIASITRRIYERSVPEMFTLIDNYSVQETRKEARRLERDEVKTESAKKMLLDGQLPENIAKWLEIPSKRVYEIKESL